MKRLVRVGNGLERRRNVCPECRFTSTFASPSRWQGEARYQRKELGSKVQTRGAKRKSTVTIKNIPQGAITPTELIVPNESDAPVYSVTIQQHLNNMRKFPDCVVLTKMGNFYELYFEQAEEYAPLLNLKLARKPTVRNNGGFIYMAGFPVHQMDRYLKILVNDLEKHVAISEEVRNDEVERLKSGGNMFDRKVVRIVTPGTLIDEKFMDPWQNNFLLGIHAERKKRGEEHQQVGLAWIDLSSGDFFTQKTDLPSLSSAIARIGPREVVIDQSFEKLENSPFMNIVRQGPHSLSFSALGSGESSKQWTGVFEETAPDLDRRQFSQAEIAAGSLLLRYVDSTQMEQTGVQLQQPLRREENEYMMVDKHSLRALEVDKTLRDGNFAGSLLHSVRRTATQSGARLLSQRLKAPSMSLEEINERLDLVEEMLEYPVLRQETTSLLKSSFDSLRLVSKFAFGRGDADDLLRLSHTIQVTAQIADKLGEHAELGTADSETTALTTRVRRGKEHIQQLLSRLSLETPQKLAERVLEAIDEERLAQLHQLEDQENAEMLSLADDVLEEAGEDKLKGGPKGLRKATTLLADRDAGIQSDVWIMRRTASPRLTTLHNELDALFSEKNRLEETWREQTGAKKLALKFVQPHGHVVHVTGAKDTTIDFSVLGKISNAKISKSTRSFYHGEWTQLGNRIEKCKESVRIEEQRVFDTLRKLVVKNIVRLRKNAAVLDELDVACGFATLATEKHWVRPLLNNGSTLNIRGGRHPTVEAGLTEQGKKFTANDCRVGDDQRILFITGPNMGGKSTFLRQNALLSILAQTGSFVPAEYAEMGLVDKMFSRVGSADNLYQDQSTFMVEMLETAEILKQATPKSFVIMDEVGRGTTPEDGVAVGFASLYHLYNVNQSRALFATHFHVLADMTRNLEKLACYCTDVAEVADGSFSYVHKLRKGVNRDPHALKVARLAGMPEEAIAVAAKVLEQIKVQSVPAIGAAGPANTEEKTAASG